MSENVTNEAMRLATTVIVLSVSGGCDPGERSASEDSGGEVAVWTIAETPMWSTVGEAGSELFDIRGLVRLSDGRIVVADGGRRLVTFDTAGAYQSTFGGVGPGPGEFAAIHWVQRLPGDTLLVADWYNGRQLSYFTADGDFVRSIRPTVPVLMLIGTLADGTMVATREHNVFPGFTPPEGVGWARGKLELLQLDGELRRVVNSMADVPHREAIRFPGMGGLLPGYPFYETIILPAGDRVYVATGDRFEIQVFSSEGREPELIRHDYEPMPLTESDLIDFLSGWFTGPSRDRIQWSAVVWNLPEGRTYPATRFLRLDQEGHLWVEEGRRDLDAPGTWSVFTRAGTYLASATMPSRFQPFDVGTESVVGVWRDELSVEHLQIRALVK